MSKLDSLLGDETQAQETACDHPPEDNSQNQKLFLLSCSIEERLGNLIPQRRADLKSTRVGGSKEGCILDEDKLQARVLTEIGGARDPEGKYRDLNLGSTIKSRRALKVS